MGKPFIFTIHDLPPLRFDDEGTLPQWCRVAAQAAVAIVTPSEFGKREIVDLLGVSPSKVHVIPNGCDHEAFHPQVKPTSSHDLEKLGIQGQFLLYAGGATQRKNVPALLEGWKAVAHQFPNTWLALAGPKDPLSLLAKESGAPRLIVLGYVAHKELRGIMKASEALICPSVYEGFGLPPLDAMALVLPVAAVDQTAVPEVVGEHAVLCRDGTVAALAGGIQTILESSEVRRRLARSGPERARLFTWERHAEQVLHLYQAVLARRNGEEKRPRANLFGKKN